MGLYFRKRIMKLPFGGRLTFGSGGFGLSFGKKNVRLHINSRGSYVNTRIPKTNIYVGKRVWTAKTVNNVNNQQANNSSGNSGCGCGGCFVAFLFLILVGGIINIISALFNGEGVKSDDVLFMLFIVLIIVYGAWRGGKYQKRIGK